MIFLIMYLYQYSSWKHTRQEAIEVNVECDICLCLSERRVGPCVARQTGRNVE